MERRVLQASYHLRENLEAIERSVSSIRKELDIDEQIVEGDMVYMKVNNT